MTNHNNGSVSAFESEIVYRLAVELARTWVIAHYLAHGTLPNDAILYAYPRGPEAAIDWGDGTMSAEDCRPLRDKRVAVTLTVEDWPRDG